MGIQLDESKSAVGLETGLNNKAKVLEQGNEVILGRVRREVPDIARSLPGRCLVDDHIVTVDTMCWEMMMTERRGRSHAHLLHGRLLGNRRLTLLIRPVAADGARAQPLPIHGAQRLLRIGTVTEGNETVASRTARLHVPHNSGFGD